jgi:hypothetical protein
VFVELALELVVEPVVAELDDFVDVVELEVVVSPPSPPEPPLPASSPQAAAVATPAMSTPASQREG